MEMGKRIHLKVLLGACCWLWMYVALAGAQSDSGLKRTLIGDKAKCQPDIEGAKDNDTVVVHYTGTLASSGKQFDTSQGGEPISFVLGKGSVIKGWDEGLKKTCVGESLRLEVPAALAYGDKAVGNGVIPANSDLVFEVTLVDLKKDLHYEELTSVECTSAQKSRNQDRVTFNYKGRLPNGTVFGEGNAIEAEIGKTGLKGWDLGLSGMCPGGARRIAIPPELGYGKNGLEGLVPPNTVIVVDVELTSIQDRVTSFLDRISGGSFSG